MILWAAGLQVSAAWTISIETDSSLKKGNYVQGTVLLVLRKRLNNDVTFLDEIYPLIEDEVHEQLDKMLAIDDKDAPKSKFEKVIDRSVEILRYVSRLEHIPHLPHWKKDAEAVRVLAGAVENDHG